MTIRCIYTALPSFPATDQAPGALRIQIGSLWVDYTGTTPIQADVDAILNPSNGQLTAIDQAAVNAILVSPGSVVRGLGLVVLDIANGVIPIKTGAPLYTTTQLVSLITSKMR